MNAKKFSDAMSELDNKYIDEALSYNAKASHAKHLRRIPIALVAAILALFLMGAGVVAIIYGDSIQNWFSHYWEAITGQKMSDEHIATIDHLSQDIGLSQTIGEVTVTVDSATIGYDNFFLLLRVDGIEFSDRYGYNFEEIVMDVKPDPVCESNGIGGYGFQYHGIDGDGSILLLLDYSYTSGIGNTRDTRPIDIVLTVENLLQNPHVNEEKTIATGAWNFEFSLDRNKEMEIVYLPDTEVMAMDLDKQELVPVAITNIALTSTGLSFQFDYNEGTLAIESHVDVILANGEMIMAGGGSGTPLEDGRTLNNSYQWLLPVNLNEIVAVQIGETQIPIP